MVSSTLVSNFRSSLENGGTVRIKSVVSENAELTIRINNSGATSPVEERVKITTPAPIPPNPPKPDDLTLWDKWMDYAKDNKVLVYGTGAATIAALLLGVFGLSRMRQRVLPIYADGQHHDDDAMGTIGRGAGGGRDTQILSGSDTIVLNPNAHFDRIAPHQVYGWLQFLDQGSTRIPIGATSVRRGPRFLLCRRLAARQPPAGRRR